MSVAWQLRCCRFQACYRVAVVVILLALSSSCTSHSSDGGGSASRSLQDAKLRLDARAADVASAGNKRRSLQSEAVSSNKNNDAAQPRRRYPLVPQCFWDPKEQLCDADDAVNIMYAIEAKPVSAYLWFLLMTYDRETACGVHTTASACNGDKAHRCIFFNDILNAIGGGSKSSGSSKSGGGSKSSSSSKKPANDAAGTDSSSSSSSSLSEELASDLPFIAAWAETDEQASSSSKSLSTETLRHLLSDQLYQQQQQLLQTLKEQLTPQQQQQLLLPDLFTAAAPPPAAAAAQPKKPAAPKSSRPTAAAPSKKPAAPAGVNSAGRNSTTAYGGIKPGPPILCTSTDLLENYIFTRSAYSNPLQAPLAMHCPGSRAYDLLKCMRLPNLGACRADPACVVVPGKPGGGGDMCVSRHVQSLDAKQMKKFTFDATLAEPSAIGSCDGACWMRQAMLCNRTSDAGECRDLSFCRWSSSTGSCTPRLYTQDNFGSSVQEYMGECADVDNRKDCEQLQLRLVNKGAYASWSMPKAARNKCSVPSIGGLLNRDSSAVRESAKLIFQAGEREEREAARQAAANAAAAAATAARLVSGRGPTVLRQIYFTEQAEQSQG